MGQWLQGRRYLLKAYDLNPKSPIVLFTLGQIVMDDRPSEAYDFFSRALLADPNEPYSRLFRAKLLLHARRFSEAFSDIDALVAIRPEVINREGYLDEDGRLRDFHIVALAERSDMFERSGQYDRAEQDLDAAVAYKRSAESLAARAEFLMVRPGRHEQALADLDEAVALDRNYFKAVYTRGLVLTNFNRFGEAFSDFDHALAIRPNDPFALMMRGRMQRNLGHPVEAADDLRAAMAISPEVAKRALVALRRAGYWTAEQDPVAMTPELRDAIRACMIDTLCN